MKISSSGVNCPEVFSVQKWDESEGADLDFGVSPENIPAVAETIITTLNQAGIDPTAVVFCGYNIGRGKELSEDWAGAADSRRQIMKIARIMSRLDAQGHFDTEPGLRDSYLNKLSDLKEKCREREGTYHYFFGDWQDLFDATYRSKENPINYAGTADGAAIGVYDKQALQIIAGQNDEEFDGRMLRATPDQISNAKVLEINLRYKTDGP